jgi:pseudouridine synthase
MRQYTLLQCRSSLHNNLQSLQGQQREIRVYGSLYKAPALHHCTPAGAPARGLCILRRHVTAGNSLLSHYYSPQSTSICPFLLHARRMFAAGTQSTDESELRLSQFIARSAGISRREAEVAIRNEQVTWNGQICTDPARTVILQDSQTSIKLGGKRLSFSLEQTRVWLAHKLPGELVTREDPLGRPTLLGRLKKPQLKCIGRLDCNTQGLIVLTNHGQYAHDMEMPQHQMHRVYRVRVHGSLTPEKIKRIESGIRIEGIHYKGMKVKIAEKRRQSTNTWLQVSCTEGKNRQIRKVFEHLRCKYKRVVLVSILCVSPASSCCSFSC